jgi:hypothetical protein
VQASDDDRLPLYLEPNPVREVRREQMEQELPVIRCWSEAAREGVFLLLMTYFIMGKMLP